MAVEDVTIGQRSTILVEEIMILRIKWVASEGEQGGGGLSGDYGCEKARTCSGLKYVRGDGRC